MAITVCFVFSPNFFTRLCSSSREVHQQELQKEFSLSQNQVYSHKLQGLTALWLQSLAFLPLLCHGGPLIILIMPHHFIPNGRQQPIPVPSVVLISWPGILLPHLISLLLSLIWHTYENKLPRRPPRHDFCGAQCPLPHCTPLLSSFGTCSPKTGLTHTQTCKNPHRVDTSWSSRTGWSYDGQGVHSLLCVAISMSPTCSSRELMQPCLAFGATWQHPNTL